GSHSKKSRRHGQLAPTVPSRTAARTPARPRQQPQPAPARTDPHFHAARPSPDEIATMVTVIPFSGLRDGTHPLPARTCEPRPLAQARQIRPAAPAGAENLGPGRQIASQDSPDGVSRIGGQAGTQAPDPTPVSSQNRGSRA